MSTDKRRDKEPTQREASLIAKLENRIEAPEDVRDIYARLQGVREYVSFEATERDTEDAVATNYVLRNQYVAKAGLKVRDPAPRINPREKMRAPGPNGEEVDSYDQADLAYARTQELLITYQQQQCKLKDIVNGAIQDAMTVPVAWIKCAFQEDFKRDTLGIGRMNDTLDSIARYERLMMDYDEGLFTEDDAQYAQLMTLRQTITEKVVADMEVRIEEVREPATANGEILFDDQGVEVMAGGEDLIERMEQYIDNPEILIQTVDLPEVAYYRGFVFQQVDPEDMRWDWTIRRPEDMCFAKWMAQRTFMTPAEIKEKWHVESDDLNGALRYDQNGSQLRGTSGTTGEDDEYGGKDPEERYRSNEGGSLDGDPDARGDTLPVWEYWDRVEGTVRCWVQGTDKLLDEYTPEANWTDFYPFILLAYNRVTGEVMGPSDTDLTASMQDEINRSRTWEAEAKRKNHPRYVVPRGSIRPDEKENLENALPFSVTELERADEVSKSIKELLPPNYNPALYDDYKAQTSMQQMIGFSGAALGAGDPNTSATAEAIGNQSTDMQRQDRRDAIEQVYGRIYTYMAQMNAQAMPLQNVVDIVGDGAVWPDMDRQEILAGFEIDIKPELSDAEARAQEIKAWLDITQISAQLAMNPILDPVPVMKHLIELMGISKNLSNFINVNALLASIEQVMQKAAMAAPPGTLAASDPNAQGDMGALGGAPQGQGLPSAPAPESVPNTPLA